MDDWIEIGHLNQIPQLGARVLNTPKGAIAVFRTAQDKIFALLDRCPHRGGPLSQGIVHGERVTCPLHNWVLDLTTGQATGADKGCARTFPVRLQGQSIYLKLEISMAKTA